MNGQGRSLDELLATVGILTHVRTDAAVDTLWDMVSDSSFDVEAQAPYHDVRGRCVAQSPCRR